MLELRKFTDLGGADHGWLNARHHFSFADYFDPDRLGFGILRVVNDDRIAAGHGFPPHPHANMEIITYVRAGEINHRDNLGNSGSTPAGSIQVMSAGTGITHAEAASATTPTVLYQIWLHPREKNVAPRWGMADFPTTPVTTALPLLVSGTEGEAPLFIHADAKLWAGRFDTAHTITQDFGPRVYLLVSTGTLETHGHTLTEGDALAITNEGPLTLTAHPGTELVVIGMRA